MNLKKIGVLFFSVCFSTTIFASDKVLYILNPDPYSQAVGSSILSLSPSIFGYFSNPASNYKNISKEVQFSYMSYYDKNYGGNVGFVLPTEKYGNFSIIVAGMDYNKENCIYKNSLMAAINYVYPIVEKYPIYTEKGAVGATIKFYNITSNGDVVEGKDETAMLFSADLGFIYSLDFIDNDLMGAVVLKNFGNDLDFDFLTENDKKQTQIFDVSARYLVSETYKVSLMADMVKHFQMMDLGYACGVETVPFYPLSLRIGWRDYRDNFNKGITAGFSLNFDKVNVAYSYSDILNSDDDQHIFSLGIAFGKVSDIGKAYDHYLGYYLRQAKEDYNNKNYISAKNKFEEILAVYPNEPVSKHYVQLLSEDLDQTDRDFSEKIEKFLAKADKALLKNNLIKARDYYSKILQLDNDNTVAKEGIISVSEKIKEQEIYANRKKHQKEITESWVKAVNYFDNGDFVYAKDEFNKILEIDPTNAGALQYLDFINKKIAKVNAVQSHNIFKQGLAEFEEENYEKALSYFNAAYLSDPSRTDIKEYIDKCNSQIKKSENALLNKSSKKDSLKTKNLTNKQLEQQMKNIYNTGLEQYTLKDYKGALETFNKLKVLSDKNKYYTYSEQIRTYTKKAKQAISKQLCAEGETLELKEQISKAFAKYKEALKYDPSNSDAKEGVEKLNTVISQKYYDQGLKYFSTGDKDKAIAMMKKALEYEPNKIEVKRFLERMEK